ncbi:MAG: hypothetical protein LBD14_01870 [Puniceicoccales bacterium]|nr:hypothetical protein [Puniceicoccales bacterium]
MHSHSQNRVWRACAPAVIAALLLFQAGPLPAQVRSGAVEGSITATYQSQRIAVECADADVGALARKAFNAHGDYTVDASGALRVRLVKTGPATLALTLDVDGVRFAQNVSGATLEEATLRACDAVLVRRGQRPLFAGRLVFVSDRTGRKEIYTGDLFFEKVRPLTQYNSITVTPRWTHDGAEVLYTTYANNNFTDIYAVDPATGRRRNVVVNARGTTTGAVSNPRTGQIAFASSGRGNMDIYLANADGTGVRALIATSNVESDPAWSADGSQLAFAGGGTGRPGIHVATPPNGAARRIPTGYNYATEPAWNPVEKTLLAFTYQAGGFGLATVDVPTGKLAKINTTGHYMQPVWCADGRHLVATQIQGQRTRLVLMDTRKNRKITPLSGTQMANCSEADYLPAK